MVLRSLGGSGGLINCRGIQVEMLAFSLIFLQITHFISRFVRCGVHSAGNAVNSFLNVSRSFGPGRASVRGISESCGIRQI